MGHLMSSHHGAEEDMAEFQGSAEQANVAYNMKKENVSGLHGVTASNESCRCMPGSVVDGPTMREQTAASGQAANVSRQSIFGQYQAHSKKIDRRLIPVLQELEKEMHDYDKALHDLKAKAEHAEQRAAELGAQFMQMKDAYSESDCKALTAEALANGEAEPTCSTQFHEAKGTVRKLERQVPSRCAVGTVKLLGIRNHSASAALIFGQALFSMASDGGYHVPGGRAVPTRRSRRPRRQTLDSVFFL